MMLNDINNKVTDLFEYRQIPYLLKLGGFGHDEVFIDKLHQLQISIYFLDQTLESNWQVSQAELSEKWRNIFENLEQLGYTGASANLLIRDILVYQRHELNMRKEKWPTFYTMKYLYYYKSCDVKLIRKLIYQRNESIGKILPENFWRFFDLTAEVNDDVDDVIEDLDTINGNRFLISILQRGMNVTLSEYLDFLTQNEKRCDAFFLQSKSNEATDLVWQWTKDELINTKNLAISQSQNISSEVLEAAQLLPFMEAEFAT